MNFLATYLNQSFYELLTLYQSYREHNRKIFIEFSKQLVIFFSKFLIKNSTQTLITILEGISQGATAVLLKDLCEQLPDLENNKEKKIVNFAYCSIISEYYMIFDTETLKFLTKKLITHLAKFNKYGSNVSINDNIFKLGDDTCAYAGNTFNRILNAEVKVKIYLN
jgi:hypothetical protein